MAGLYIHIPFCKTRCNYCDFYSTTDNGLIIRYVDTLRSELRRRSSELRADTVDTIYFGGGTPSQVDLKDLSDFISFAKQELNVNPNAEITIEVNPDDVDDEFIVKLQQSPFNRVSVGVQSFHDEDLLLLDRRHNSAEAFDTIRNIQSAGVSNISIDLMYGIPNLNKDKWLYNLETVAKLGVPHLSAYSLTYYENTKLTKLAGANNIKPVSEDEYVSQFYVLTDWAEANEFEHYELANFAKAACQSKHNSSYWTGIPYIGLGASAHSYDGKDKRSFNCSSLTEYVNRYGECQAIEILSLREKYNDYVLCSSRTIWGIDTDYVYNNFGKELHEKLLKKLSVLCGKQLLVENPSGSYIATREGYLQSNIIAEELIEI
ncbi:MAG: radical SAM family heme chaperone HemW [Bacteroidales bacterium]